MQMALRAYGRNLAPALRRAETSTVCP
jgi:hypothetical protein